MEAESFYDQFAATEWTRLERHRTEFAVTLKAVRAHLPPAPCSILDIGGGPGRYAIELVRLGHAVTLLDVSSLSLKLAQEKAKEVQVTLADCIHGNALDLVQCEADSFDAVLMLGPLYHLLAEADRIRAIREARRVLRRGGRLFAAFITRFAPFRKVGATNPAWLAQNQSYAEQLYETGIHDRPTRFAKAYYVHPDEVLPLMESCDLYTLALVGCEGVLAGHEDQVNELSGEAWEAWVAWNYRLGLDPALYGAADHLLYIGEKP